MTAPLSLARLNALGRAEFAVALAGIYEHSPWIPERAHADAPFADPAELRAALRRVVAAARVDEQLGLLNAHPELAGKDAAAGTLTAHSTDEQKGAGLVNLSAAETEEIARLNRRYREKFGVPFIIAVKNHTRSSIFAEFRRRVEAIDVAAERQACLEQVHEIARFRLAALLAVGPENC